MRVYVLCSTDAHEADAYVEGVYSTQAEANAAARQAEVVVRTAHFPLREYMTSEHELDLGEPVER